MSKRGPKTKYDNGFHNILRERVKESRASRNELKTAISELTMMQLHQATKEAKLLKPVSLTPLPKFYANIAENLYQKCNKFFTREDIENQVRIHTGKTAEQLRRQINAIEKKLKGDALAKMCDITEQIYDERKKAQNLLETEFGTVKTRHFVEEAELENEMSLREDLWLNAMEFLKNKGFAFYPAKLASDVFVFPTSLGDVLEPYKYTQFTHGVTRERRYKPKFLLNPKIQNWRAEEAEETAKLKEAFETVDKELERRRQIRIRREKQALDRVKPWLIQCVEYGYRDERILKGIRKAAWIKPYETPVMQLVASLRKQGYKPLDGKFKVDVEVLDEEEPKNLTVNVVMQRALNKKWLGCMEAYRGHKPEDPPEDWKPPEFEQAFLFCTKKTQKDDYARQINWEPKPALIQQAKKLWSNIPTAKPRTEFGGEKFMYESEITQKYLDDACKIEWGPEWYYDQKLNACVSNVLAGTHDLHLDGEGRPDIEHKGTPFRISRVDPSLLRGRMVHRQPETNVGVSVVRKTTQMGKDVIHRKQEKKKVIRMKV